MDDAVPSTLIAVAAVAIAVAGVLVVVAAILTRVRGIRLRRRMVEAAVERDELRLTLAEQTDRLRAVGELTDLAAVAVSALGDRADRLRLLITTEPDAAGRSAAELAVATRTAIADLRRAADLARSGVADAAELGPAPGLADLDGLVARAEARGLTVRLREDGARPDLAPAAGLAVYRILQEALDNAAEHGGPGTEVRVAIRWSADGMQLSVDDDGERVRARAAEADGASGQGDKGRRDGTGGRGGASGPAYTVSDDLAALVDTPYGRGLTELRQRAESFGGTVALDRTAGVGFSVAVSIPQLRTHNGVHGVAR